MHYPINGNTTNVTALKASPGGDGISYPEANEAVNNTEAGERILIAFAQAGTMQCDASVPVQTMQRAKVTVDGDVDGQRGGRQKGRWSA